MSYDVSIRPDSEKLPTGRTSILQDHEDILTRENREECY